MKLTSRAANTFAPLSASLIPKILCGMAGAVLVAFFLFYKGNEAPSVTTIQEEKGQRANSQDSFFPIKSFPFTISNGIVGGGLHIYQTAFPLDNGTIVWATLKTSDDAELELYISDEKETLNSSKTKAKGEEEAALTFFGGGKASIIVGMKNEAKKDASYTLWVDTKGIERLIETLPYTTSGRMSRTDTEGEKWHWYQIAFSVPAGTIVSADLTVTGNANMDVTIFVDKDILSYGANHGVGENEHAELTVEKDSKVYVIIDNVEGEGDYSLTVTSAASTKR